MKKKINFDGGFCQFPVICLLAISGLGLAIGGYQMVWYGLEYLSGWRLVLSLISVLAVFLLTFGMN